MTFITVIIVFEAVDFAIKEISNSNCNGTEAGEGIQMSSDKII